MNSKKKKFKIEYQCPDTQEWITEIKEFENVINVEITDEFGEVIGHCDISANKWAEDYAYSKADKGRHKVTRL